MKQRFLNYYRGLSDREQRTIRIGGIAVIVMIVAVGGQRLRDALNERVAAYESLRTELGDLHNRITVRRAEVETHRKLTGEWQIKFDELDAADLVTTVREMIEGQASSRQLSLTPIRETHPNGSYRAVLSFELNGGVPAIADFLFAVRHSGYATLFDRYTMKAGKEPGTATLSVGVGILGKGAAIGGTRG